EPERRHRSAAGLEQALRHFLGWRWIAIAGATASLLILALLAVMLLYPWSKPRSFASTSTSPPPVSASAPGPVRIVQLDIEHMAQRGKNDFDPRGKLGERSFAVRPDDDVTVHAELSEPAYAYLIAFRPDGVDELCDPDDPEVPPGKTKEPR